MDWAVSTAIERVDIQAYQSHLVSADSRAMWIQPGQVSGRLHYDCCDITDDLSICDLRHNIFGSFSDVD